MRFSRDSVIGIALNVQIANAESRKPLENKAFHTLEAMLMDTYLDWFEKRCDPRNYSTRKSYLTRFGKFVVWGRISRTFPLTKSVAQTSKRGSPDHY